MRIRLLSRGIFLTGILVFLACGGSEASKTLPSGSKSAEVLKEKCVTPEAKVEAIDMDHDGKIDVKYVVKNGYRYCSELDIDRDGFVDVIRFYEKDGSPKRDEHHFDFDHKADEIAFYKDGQIVRRELDTNFDAQFDTWIWCEGDYVARSERDRSHNGKTDTWETYKEGVLLEAKYDQDNNGKVDRWETFKAGRLAVIQRDTDNDGKPDVKEEIPERDRGMPDDRLACRVLKDSERVPEEEKKAAKLKGTDDNKVDETPWKNAEETKKGEANKKSDDKETKTKDGKSDVKEGVSKQVDEMKDAKKEEKKDEAK